MNKCVQLDIQEMLPDLLHRSLDASARARVEAHLAECEACTEELRVLRTVASAAVFAPRIDVDGIVRQIPPYRMPTPAQKRAPSRVVSWLVAASLLLVAAGGGSLLLVRGNGTVNQVAVRGAIPQTTPTPTGSDAPKVSTPASAASVAPEQQAMGTLALAAGVDGLSDSDLRQLMNDMDDFDALPAAEPEPVISVDGSDNVEIGG